MYIIAITGDYLYVAAHAKMTTDRQEYGQVELRDDKVVWSIGGQTEYIMPVADIKVIGEFTIDTGPYLDDWFLTIITADDWYEIPMDAFGIDQLLIDLGQRLGTNLSYQLANSTDWKSRIMYPDNSKDQELYDIIDIESKTFWDRVKQSIGLNDTTRKLSDKTKEIMKK